MTANGWIKHEGGTRPVAPDTWVQRRSLSGVVSAIMQADDFRWDFPCEYRVFAPVVDPSGSPDFVRETAARIMAAMGSRDGYLDYTDAAHTKIGVKAAVRAAQALEAALNGVKP